MSRHAEIDAAVQQFLSRVPAQVSKDLLGSVERLIERGAAGYFFENSGPIGPKSARSRR